MGRADRILNEQAWVPKPFRSNLEWAVAKAMVSNPRMQRNVPERNVALEKIQTTQDRLDKEKVDQLANSEYTDGGLAFNKSGTIYLWDGHHRHFAAQKLGLESRKLKVLKMTDDNTLSGEGKEGMSLRDWASVLGVRVATILKSMEQDDLRHYETHPHHLG